jgi:uncharacterized membrane protein
LRKSTPKSLQITFKNLKDLEEDKMRKLTVLMALFVISVMCLSLVQAVSLEDTLSIDELEVNDQEADLYTQEEVDATGSIDDLSGVAVEEGETLEIEVFLEAAETTNDVEIEVEIKGYEYSDYDDLDDQTHSFDMDVSGTGITTKKKTLSIDLPAKLDKDRYFLRITVTNKDSAALVRYVVLQIEPPRHGLTISDVAFSPGNTVKAGRSLLTSVLLQNFGDKHEKDVKVTVALPELGVSATEFVDVVKMDDDNGFNNVEYEDVPEMFLQVPGTAAAGEYNVLVTATYDDLRETVSKTYKINVVENEMFQTSEGVSLLGVAADGQSVVAGSTAKYGIALANAGKTSKAYTLSVVTGDWATASLSENLVVLESGKNKVVYVDLTVASNAPEGQHAASLLVKSGNEVLETIPLTANVVAGTESDNVSLRNGLEIALIVLVVLLVIIGLIIGFSRLRKDEDEEEQTYY